MRHSRVGSGRSYRMGKIHKLGPQLCWKLPGWHRRSLSGTPLVKGTKLRQILLKNVCLLGLGCRQGGESSMGSPAKHLSGENGAHSEKLCFPSGVDILGWRSTSGHREGPEVVEWEFKPHGEWLLLHQAPSTFFLFFFFNFFYKHKEALWALAAQTTVRRITYVAPGLPYIFFRISLFF